MNKNQRLQDSAQETKRIFFKKKLIQTMSIMSGLVTKPSSQPNLPIVNFMLR